MLSIEQFDRLYGEKATERSEDFIFSELLETRSRDFEWNIKRHIHPRLYQIFIVERGVFSFYEAGIEKKITAPSILFIPPTKLHGFRFENETKGRIVSFADSIIDLLLEKFALASEVFEELQFEIFDITDKKYLQIQDIAIWIEKELSNIYTARSVILQAYLQQLFVLILRLFEKEKVEDLKESVHISYIHYRKFQQLIRKAEKYSTVEEYAKILGITTVHLNRICNAISGKSASKIIHEVILSRAQKYLLHTSYSISEIAYRLNFEYPNYFSRFFKKHVGMTPKEFKHNSFKTDY